MQGTGAGDRIVTRLAVAFATTEGAPAGIAFEREPDFEDDAETVIAAVEKDLSNDATTRPTSLAPLEEPVSLTKGPSDLTACVGNYLAGATISLLATACPSTTVLVGTMCFSGNYRAARDRVARTTATCGDIPPGYPGLSGGM